jgi:hypothetical protein
MIIKTIGISSIIIILWHLRKWFKHLRLCKIVWVKLKLIKITFQINIAKDKVADKDQRLLYR